MPAASATPAFPVRIRKIGHVGLFCRDLPKMVDFYTRVLGFKQSDVNERGLTFLRFSDDHHNLALMQLPEGEKDKPAGRPVVQQISYELDSLDDLKALYRHLVAHGVKIKGDSIQHEGPGNNFVIDFDDPDGNNLQFFSGMDVIGWDGRSRPQSEWNRYQVKVDEPAAA